MNTIFENNKVDVCGQVASPLEFAYEVFGEAFYRFTLKIKRKSVAIDELPVTISERIIDTSQNYEGAYMRISGQLRTSNRQDGEKRKLFLAIFVKEYQFCEDKPYDTINNISIEGYVCKEPIYRETPLGKKITDLLIGVNRPYKKSDYIPCIAWGRNALFASGFEVGAYIRVSGRIQSRIYRKKISDTEFEERTAYEVSISTMEVINE